MVGTKTYSVTRYDPALSEEFDGVEMVDCGSGSYVTYEDYQDLEDSLADAEAKLTLLKNKIADLFREM